MCFRSLDWRELSLIVAVNCVLEMGDGSGRLSLERGGGGCGDPSKERKWWNGDDLRF